MSLTPECLAQLGLLTEPFGPVPEDSALYRDALLDGFGDLALRALSEPSAILVLAGAGGVGRSTQLQQILSLLPEDRDLIAFRARPKVGFEAVDATLRFHLGQLGNQDPSASLVHLFGERLRAGRVLLLAIDDAHLLGSQGLEQLFALRQQLLERLGATARFFLVGDPAFAANPLPGLDSEADTQVLRLHLRAFNREQTHGYLRQRLASAGHGQPDALLKRDLVDRLHSSSSGLPKYLNALAEDWLEELCDQNAYFAENGPSAHPPPSARAPAAAPGMATPEAPADAMVSAMSALEALRNASSQGLELHQGQPTRARANASPGARSEQTQADLAGKQAGAGKDSGRGGKQSQQPTKGQKTRKKGHKQAQTRAPEEMQPIWNRPWFVPGVAVFSLVALLLPLVWQLPSSNGGNTTTGSRPKDLPGAERTQIAPVAPGTPLVAPQLPDAGGQQPTRREMDVPPIFPSEPGPTTTVDAEGAEGAGSEATEVAPRDDQPLGVERQADTAIASSDAATEPGETAEQTGSESQLAPETLDRDWILQQSGQDYTIQLAATSSLSAARQHVAGYLNVDARFVPTRTNSQNFVVVLAGVYSARAEAERALKQLPAALREQGHWIRTIDSVRQSLRE